MTNNFAKCKPNILLAGMSYPVRADFESIPFCAAHMLFSLAEDKMEPQQLNKPENGFSHQHSTV